jgi:hypothetical protein
VADAAGALAILTQTFRIGFRLHDSNPDGAHMGDKSPKAKDKAKKQDTASKDQKKTNASNKASTVAAKKGK